MNTLTSTNEHDRANAERTIARSLKFSQQQREHARTLINPAGLINDILEMDTQLTPTLQDDGQYNVIGKDHLAVISKRIDLKLKLLNKALPDLKSTEITGIIDHNHGLDVTKMGDIELAQRLLLWQAKQAAALAPNVIDITPVTQQDESANTTESADTPADTDPLPFL